MPHRLAPFWALVLLAQPGSAAAADSPPSAEAGAAALERTLLPPVTVEGVKPWTLELRMRRYHVPGVSIALIQRGRVAWAKGYGVVDVASRAPVTAHTLFQAASLSKPVTALAVLRLVDQGKLSLVAPVNTLLKGWKLPEGPFNSGVTLERLLSHTAGVSQGGFPGYPVGAPLPTLLQVLNGQPPANTPPLRVDAQPGSSFRYSGGGYVVVQQLLEDVTGQPFTTLLRDTVLGPAGMEESNFEQPPQPEVAARAATGYGADGVAIPGRWRVYPELAAGGLWTTPTDLARFAIALQQSVAGAPEALLSKTLATRMTTEVAERSGLGVFVGLRGKGTFEHATFEQPGTTQGFKALLVASVEGGYGLVVMANGDGGLALAEELLRGAAQVFGWKELATGAVVKRFNIDAARLRQLSGRYRIGSDELLTLAPGRDFLEAKPLLGERFELFPVAANEFLRLEPPMLYRLDDAGLVLEGPLGQRNGLRIPASTAVPLELLLGGKPDAAIAAYRALRRMDRSDPAISEPRLNDLAYELLARDKEKALVILELNAEFYPESANSWDSLGEAQLGAGNRPEALRCYRKVLELLPKDKHLSASNKSLLQRNAELQVRELGGH
jgi:CubicO group peptidase (beta-lactamase class C family)